MPRIAIQLGRRREFHNPPQVHYGHPIGDMPHNGQIVRNEQVGDAKFFLQLGEQVHHLGLNGDIEGRNGFIANDQIGLGGERPGDADPLRGTHADNGLEIAD